jgi:hypothetical protein
MGSPTKSSQDTAGRDIDDLVKRGALVKNPGGGRSTSYSLANPAVWCVATPDWPRCLPRHAISAYTMTLLVVTRNRVEATGGN